MTLQNPSRHILMSFAVLLLCGAVTSCKSSKKSAEVITPKYETTISGTDSWGATPKKLDKTREALVKEARRWLGTPYRYGGNDSDGLDCSGLTMKVYKNVMDVSIPRNSSRQAEYCLNIGRENVEAGDLVFFSKSRSGSAINHVGIYIGDGKMIHSSSSRGVIISGLDENYYVDRFVMAGRVPALAKASDTRQYTPLESAPTRYMPVEPAPVVVEQESVVVDYVPADTIRPARKAKKQAEPTVDPAEVVKNAFRKK
jgi:lipoprotein Spr